MSVIGNIQRVWPDLELLTSHGRMRSRIHGEHDEQHDVSREAAGLRVMLGDGGLLPDLGALDVDEVHVMSGRVDDGEEEHRVGDLAMEPVRFVDGNESAERRPQEDEDVAEDRHQQEAAVDAEAQASAARDPDLQQRRHEPVRRWPDGGRGAHGVPKAIEDREPGVARLLVPAEGKDSDVSQVEERAAPGPPEQRGDRACERGGRTSKQHGGL